MLNRAVSNCFQKDYGSACWARTSDPLINSLQDLKPKTHTECGLQPDYEVAHFTPNSMFLGTFRGCRATSFSNKPPHNSNCAVDKQISFQCRRRVVLGLLYAFKPKGSKAWGGSFFRTPFGPPGDITSVMAVKQPGESFFRTPFLPSCTTNRRDMRAVRLKSVANQSGNCPSTRAMRFRHGEPMAVGESPAPFSMSEAALKVEAQSGLTSPQKKLLSGPGEPRAHHEYGQIVSRSNALPSLSLFPWWPSNGTATALGMPTSFGVTHPRRVPSDLHIKNQPPIRPAFTGYEDIACKRVRGTRKHQTGEIHAN